MSLAACRLVSDCEVGAHTLTVLCYLFTDSSFLLLVILDIYPFFTTIIILFGWIAKTVVATLLSTWVGGDENTGEAWLAYSIP